MQNKVSQGESQGANDGAQSNSARNGHFHNATPTGHVFSVAEVAEMLGLKEQSNGKFCGAPEGTGKTKDGFILNPGGTAFTNDGTKYTSREVAQLAGISPDQYAPIVEYRAGKSAAAPSRPVAPKAAQDAPKSPQKGTGDDNVIIPLEARGLTPETIAFFEVERIQGSAANRNGWKYPTFHANGNQSRTRFKNARAKSEVEKKYLWWKGGYNREPDGYNLQNVPEGALDVWIVGGEPDVWMMHQNGFCATATFGETQGAAKLVAALKSKSVARVHIALDADEAGFKGAQELERQCIAQGMDYTDHVFQGACGHDVCDEFGRAGRDREKFVAAMESLPERAIAAEVAQPEPMFPRLKLHMIFARPDLEDLVENLLRERTTSVFGAAYGCFKSFVLLDLGLSVATGRKWQGRRVKQGRVVYIVAEGAYETKARAKAWLQFHGIEDIPDDFEIIEIPVQIAQFYPQLIAELREFAPALVIIDTVAQCNVGRDENDTGAMGEFTHAMRAICRELGAHVACAHHTGKNGQLRGNTSLPANLDTSITLKKAPGRVVTIECDRTKGAPFSPFSLVGRIVELPERNKYGQPLTSLVFVPTDTTTEDEPELSAADQTRETVFRALQNAPKGLTATQWQKVSALSASRFYDVREALVLAGRVAQNGRIYKVTPITPIYSDSERSEPNFYSDYSDDALASEQSEQMAAKLNRSKKRVANSEPYAAPVASDDSMFGGEPDEARL